MSLEDLRKTREEKLDLLKKAGVNPYPAKSSFQLSEVAAVKKNFEKHRRSRRPLAVAGRVMAKRAHGQAAFLDIFDGSEKLQIFLAKDKLGEKSFALFSETVDIGDFIAAYGKVFLTKKKEQTLEAVKWEMLTKSLRPLPEKWHGLQDAEERFRKRYLDLLMNTEVRERFQKRTKIILELRQRLQAEGFMEVETPQLQPLPGGATARPFVTHHNALDIDLYLRIAPELYLKRLLIGGYGKVFEIGRNFRNEGIDRDHNPEFTMLELYWAWQDYRGLMTFVQKLLKKWLPGKWRTLTFSQLVKNPTEENYKEARNKIKEPTFIIDYPEALMPLAKLKPENPKLTESFQLIANGAEVVKGFSELNDPLFQRQQMERQEAEHRRGNEEASRLDEDFLEALECGMPPAAGLGLGIDRLAMLLTETKNDVITIPASAVKSGVLGEYVQIVDKEKEISLVSEGQNDENIYYVEKSIKTLKENNLLDKNAIKNLDITKLADSIRSSGYYKQKARKLKEFVNFKGEITRDNLLGMWGIGPETADSILLYAYNKPVFVIDAYTKRIFTRLGIRFNSYDEYQGYFHKNLPKDYKLFNDYHALLVELAKKHCKTKENVAKQITK
ncbi:MAG: Lysine-tRNA ligase, partial [Candidatus Adlerbacteria bacterium GW2011_GWC1_50_9]